MPTKVYVSQVMLPLMDDFNDAYGDYILRSTLANENLGDITGAILDINLSSLSSNVDAFYDYGASGLFVDGLPTGNATTGGSLDISVIEPTLEGIAGEPVVLISAVVLPLGFDDGVLNLLFRNYGYDPATGIVHNHNFDTANPVTFDYVDVIVVTGAGPKGSQTTTRKEVAYVLVDGVSTIIDSVAVAVHNTSLPTDDRVGTVTLTLKATYYLISDAARTPIEWLYTTGDGFTLIDEAMSGTSSQQVYPIVTVREAGVNIIDGTDTERSDSSRVALNALGISLDEISQNLDDEAGTDDIEDAHVFLSIHVDDARQEVRRYLFDYYDVLNTDNPDSKFKYDEWLLSRNQAFTGIQFTIDERSLTYQLNINYIERTNGITANVGPIGTVQYVATDMPNNGRDASFLTYTRQITSTTCDVIVVHGIRNECSIGATRTQISTAIISELGDTEASKSIVVPLSKLQVDKLSTRQANVVIAASYQLNLYARVVRKIKWYNSFLFQSILSSLALILAAYTAGQSLWVTTLAASVGAVAATMLFLLEVGLNFAIGKLILRAAQIIADKIGGKLALIIAVVVVIAAIVTGNYNNQFTKLFNAEDLLTASNALVKGVSANAAEDLKEIHADYEAKQEELELAYDKLEEYDSLFDEGIDLYTQTYKEETINNPNEHPDAFYDRTSDLDYTITGPTYQLDKFYENAVVLPGSDY